MRRIRLYISQGKLSFESVHSRSISFGLGTRAYSPITLGTCGWRMWSIVEMSITTSKFSDLIGSFTMLACALSGIIGLAPEQIPSEISTPQNSRPLTPVTKSSIPRHSNQRSVLRSHLASPACWIAYSMSVRYKLRTTILFRVFFQGE